MFLRPKANNIVILNAKDWDRLCNGMEGSESSPKDASIFTHWHLTKEISKILGLNPSTPFKIGSLKPCPKQKSVYNVIIFPVFELRTSNICKHENRELWKSRKPYHTFWTRKTRIRLIFAVASGVFSQRSKFADCPGDIHRRVQNKCWDLFNVFFKFANAKLVPWKHGMEISVLSDYLIR